MAASLAASLAAQNPDTATSSSSASTMADTSTPPATAGSTHLAHHDRAFIEKAVKCGLKEVAVSQAVTGRLSNPQLRDFANNMVTDHTAANNELMRLAASKGVVLPSEKDDTMTAKLTEKWSDKSGNVDKKYLSEMIDDHEDAVKLFEKAAKSDDADIASFAQKTLPTLQHHLSMAKELKKTLDL